MKGSETVLAGDAECVAVRLAAAAAADNMWLPADLTCVLTACLTLKAEMEALDYPSSVSLGLYQKHPEAGYVAAFQGMEMLKILN